MAADDDDAEGRHLDMTAPAPGGAPAGPGGQASRTVPLDRAPRHATGFFDPRWVLLAGVWYMPAAIVGFGVHYYYSVGVCQLGMLNALCMLDVMPAPAQAALMLAGFVVALVVAVRYGHSNEWVFLSELTSAPDPAQARGSARTSPQARANLSAFTRLMRDVLEFQRVRPLAWALAALVALGLALELLRGQLDGVTVALGLIALVVTLRCASYRPRRPAEPQRAAAGVAAEQPAAAQPADAGWAVVGETPPAL
jgi:hypothetical protein